MEKRVNKRWQWHTLGLWTRLLTEWSQDSLGFSSLLSLFLSHSLSSILFLSLSVHDSSRICWIESQSLSEILEAARGTCRYLLLSPSRFISLERSLSVSLDRSIRPIYELLRAVNCISISARYLTTSICRPQIRVARKRAFDITIHESTPWK